MNAIKLHEDKGLVAFAADWNAGFKNGTFATVTCPAWMMGYIQGQAPDASGKWNIADVPGGGGNWGGSFLTVTKQSQHQAAGGRARQVPDLAQARRRTSSSTPETSRARFPC